MLLPSAISLLSEDDERHNIAQQSLKVKRGLEVEQEKRRVDDAFSRRTLRSKQNRQFRATTRHPSYEALLRQGERPVVAMSSSFAYKNKKKNLNRIVKAMKEQQIDLQNTSALNILNATRQYIKEVGKLDHDGIKVANYISQLLDPSSWSGSAPVNIRSPHVAVQKVIQYLENNGVLKTEVDSPSIQRNLKTHSFASKKSQQPKESLPTPSNSKTDSSSAEEHKESTETYGKFIDLSTTIPEESKYPGLPDTHAGVSFRNRQRGKELYPWYDSRSSKSAAKERAYKAGGSLDTSQSVWRTFIHTEIGKSSKEGYYEESMKQGLLENAKPLETSLKQLPQEEPTTGPATPRPRSASLLGQANRHHLLSSVESLWRRHPNEYRLGYKESNSLDPIAQRANVRRPCQIEHTDFDTKIPQGKRLDGQETPTQLERLLRRSARKSTCCSVAPSRSTSRRPETASTNRPRSASSITLNEEALSAMGRRSSRTRMSRPQSSVSLSSAAKMSVFSVDKGDAIRAKSATTSEPQEAASPGGLQSVNSQRSLRPKSRGSTGKLSILSYSGSSAL